jgi:hypothetical protein
VPESITKCRKYPLKNIIPQIRLTEKNGKENSIIAQMVCVNVRCFQNTHNGMNLPINEYLISASGSNVANSKGNGFSHISI